MIMNELNSLEAKQAYLRVQIMEAGYDAETFMDFCEQRYTLDDLEHWPMQQLVDIVGEFIATQQKTLAPLKQTQNSNLFQNFQDLIVSPPATKKAEAVVFSDDDWGLFLSGGGGSLGVGSAKSGGMGANISHTKPTPKTPPSIATAPTFSNTHLQIQKTPINHEIIEHFQIKQSPTIIPTKTTIPPPKSQLPTSSQLIPDDSALINLSKITISVTKDKPMIPLSPISDIVISSTEQKSRSFLQSDFTLYHITLLPSKQTIKRKFNDFRKLRAILCRMYPHFRLPYLEPQGWLVTSSEGKDPQMLDRYKRMVIQFMKYILCEKEELKGSSLIRSFCELSPVKSEVKKLFQIHENLPKPKYIGELVLPQPKLVIPPTSPNQKIVNNTTKILLDLEVHYDRLRKQLDTLFSNYQQVHRSLDDISTTFQGLENTIKRYNFENNEAKEVIVFQGVKEICQKMNQAISLQELIFKDRLKQLMRYEKDNINTLRQVMDVRNRIHSEYIRQSSPTMGMKSGETVEVESSVPLEEGIKSNKNLLAIQEIFWSHHTEQEIKLYWDHLRKRISQFITVIAYDELDNENKCLNFWNAMIKKCLM